MARKTHAEKEVERLAVSLWRRVSKVPLDQYSEWSVVKAHLWGVSDGLRIAGKWPASDVADFLGFLAGELSVLRCGVSE